MHVLMPGRILERHVGGNTTYARTIAEGLRARNVSVDSIKFGGNPLAAIGLESLEALKRHSRDTILHYVADTGPLVPTRTPSVVTVHGVASKWVSGVRSGKSELIWRSRVRAAIKCTNRIITVSESSANDISEVFNISRESIAVIPHGIDCEKFQEKREFSDVTGARIPSEYLLYLGNIEPRKNIVELVKACSSAEIRELGLPLVVAGKPAWDSEQSIREIESSSNVIYLGFVSEDDKIALMQNCTAFVFPSKYEGFGFPVLEAMAAGAPVVTSSRGSLQEVAGPSHVLEDIDSYGIARGITAALNNSEWIARAPASGQRWASKFSWDSSIQSHIDVYREVIS